LELGFSPKEGGGTTKEGRSGQEKHDMREEKGRGEEGNTAGGGL